MYKKLDSTCSCTTVSNEACHEHVSIQCLTIRGLYLWTFSIVSHLPGTLITGCYLGCLLFPGEGVRFCMVPCLKSGLDLVPGFVKDFGFGGH